MPVRTVFQPGPSEPQRPERTTRYRCARCHVSHVVVSAVLDDGTLRPDPDQAMRVCGWVEQVQVPGKRELATLHDGTEALVQRPARMVRVPWCCGGACALVVAAGIASGASEHSLDASALAHVDPRLRPAAAERPIGQDHHRRDVIEAVCAACQVERIELPADAERAMPMLTQRGWVVRPDRKLVCSQRCLAMATVHAPRGRPVTKASENEGPAVVELADVSYQATRARLRVAAGLPPTPPGPRVEAPAPTTASEAGQAADPSEGAAPSDETPARAKRRAPR